MTRLYDVSIGRFDQFKRLLAEHNLTAEELDEVIHRPVLVGVMLEALRKRIVLGLESPLSELRISPFVVQLLQNSGVHTLRDLTKHDEVAVCQMLLISRTINRTHRHSEILNALQRFTKLREKLDELGFTLEGGQHDIWDLKKMAF